MGPGGLEPPTPGLGKQTFNLGKQAFLFSFFNYNFLYRILHLEYHYLGSILLSDPLFQGDQTS